MSSVVVFWNIKSDVAQNFEMFIAAFFVVVVVYIFVVVAYICLIHSS